METTTVKELELEKQIRKQIGCMAGFFHIFDRPVLFSGKRLYNTKRLPPPHDIESEAPESAESSPQISRGRKQIRSPLTTELRSPAPEPKTLETESPSRSPLPLPIFENKESTKSPWKFYRDAPRLSLDSRAVVDAKGSLKPRQIATNDADKQRRSSPSVIARLMGLEQLPSSDSQTENKAELRRSASESRVNREYFPFINGTDLQLQQSIESIRDGENVIGDARNGVKKEYRGADSKQARALQPQRCVVRGKTFFDSMDFFPEPKQKTVSVYGEIETSSDLETLKQLLEALQLKGLLHKSQCQSGNRNFVYERSLGLEESPIVVIKPARSPVQIHRTGRTGKDSRTGGVLQSVSPTRDGPAVDRNTSNYTRGRSPVSPTRSESSVKSPIRRANGPVERRRLSSPVQSPVRRTGPVQMMNRRSRNDKEDESSSISACSQNDAERWRVEEYKGGRDILERCDKLLHSIAEMTAAAATTESRQPSPVSVLDSSFCGEESSTSPVMKRSLDFGEQQTESEDETWSSAISTVESKSDDCDFTYISDVVRALDYLPEGSDIFLLLEKQQHLKGKCTSKVSRLERKLIFDTIHEILNRRRHLPLWKAIRCSGAGDGQTSLQQIWSEYQKIRDIDTSDKDVFQIICGVLRKDFGDDALNGWEDCPLEMSEAVFDIERLIFKDLIGETIRDLAAPAGECNVIALPRRKLVF